MDNRTKVLLLEKVVEYAKIFQATRKRRKMVPADIHDALHALGLRPLFASLHVSSEELVSTNEIVSSEHALREKNFSISTFVESDWIPTIASSDNFRKRKQTVTQPAGSLHLSERSKFYTEKVVNDIASLRTCILSPPTDSDILVTAWFLGLYFTDTVVSSESVHWLFVRNALWYLERAEDVCEDSKFTASLFSPWLNGLARLADNHCSLEGCESPQQASLIRNLCRNVLVGR